MKETIVLIIKLYQSSIGRFLGGQCRFVPSCSEYAIEAVRQFGPLKGTYMAVKRLLRCHPFGSKGFDPPSLPPSLKLWRTSKLRRTGSPEASSK
ncbi:MAG: membrane protein insertion efficiency factor YidD [Phycisphaerae bacterium]|jgi:hypothetical protein